LNKIANLRLGVIVIPWIHEDWLDFLLLKRDWVGDPDEIEHNFQYLSVIIHIVLRFWKLTQFIHMRLEVAQKLLVFLYKELDGVERLRLYLEGIVDF
jgi:hypothetical protein